jgi:uncharacterized repeat protein (TIGR03803 family)
MHFSNTALDVSQRPARASILRSNLLVAAVLACVAALAQAQTVSTVYTFTGGTTGAANPNYVTLVQGTSGALYGTSYNGGSKSEGTFFSVTTSGAFTLLYSFGTATKDGTWPTGGLTLGTDGNFYGTTNLGGSSSQGTIFKMTTAGVETILHNFNSATDGAFPFGPPIEASNGDFYGTASGGGKDEGLVYQITSTGTYTTIFTFSGTNGAVPIAPPVQGVDGYLYVVASVGGGEGCGAVAKISTAGVLDNYYSFPCQDGGGGANPIGPLVQAASGNFYSTTEAGGTNGQGTIYQITTGLVATVLYNFGASVTDGADPSSGLLLATDGNYYGSTEAGGTYDDGILFNTSTAGAYDDLYSFNNSANQTQESPLAPPVQATNGTLYGVTEFGGTDNKGTVYSLNMGLPAFVNTAVFSGKEGQKVTLLGNNLKDTTSVTFNGTAATFTVNSESQLTATVPTGATTGAIHVTTPKADLVGRKDFQVLK